MTPPDAGHHARTGETGPGEIRNASGERLDHTFVSGRPGQEDVVVIAHGVTSQRDRPWAADLAAALTAAGIAVVQFSFSGNGASEGRFEDATPTKEVEDLGSILDAFPGFRVACVGHSMGGAVSLLRASRDPRIAALVSLAGMLHVHEFMQRHFGHLRPGDAMLEKPACPWNRNLEEDARRLGSLTDVARGIRIPWLLVHGTADELRPPAGLGRCPGRRVWPSGARDPRGRGPPLHRSSSRARPGGRAVDLSRPRRKLRPSRRAFAET